MATRFPFWNCTSVTNNFCICLSLIATGLCMAGMRPCGLLANYFTSCPTQPVVNICLKMKSFDYSSEISFSKCNGFISLHCNVCCLSCLFVMMMALKGSGSIILQHWPVSSDFRFELSPHAQHYVLFQTHKKIFCNPPNQSGESGFHVNLDKINIC